MFVCTRAHVCVCLCAALVTWTSISVFFFFSFVGKVFIAMAGAESQNPQHCEEGSDDGCLEIGIKAMVHPGFSPAFWDNLSKVWLTRGALKEIDRRNAAHPTPPRRASTLPSRKAYSESLERFARHGGPDLCHLRGVRCPSLPPIFIVYYVKLTLLFLAPCSTTTSTSPREKSRTGPSQIW